MVSVATLQNSFVRYLPWMQKTTRLAFRNLDAEKRAEEVASVIALCWKAWARLGERGLADNPLLLKSVLFYSVKTGQGRAADRLGGKASGRSKPSCLWQSQVRAGASGRLYWQARPSAGRNLLPIRYPSVSRIVAGTAPEARTGFHPGNDNFGCCKEIWPVGRSHFSVPA